MTIPADNYVPVKTLGNGSTVDFNFNWNVIQDTNMRVYLENVSTGEQVLQVLDSDYTLVFDATGGTVTYAVAPPNTEYSLLARDIAKTQETKYTTSSGFQGVVTENSFDKLTAITQDNTEALDRTFKLALGTTGVDTTYPVPVANKAFLWNSTGTAIINSTDDFNDIVDDATAQADAAAASAAAALVSEGLADADATQTAADRVQTGLDLIATNQDTIDTAADLVETNQDTIDTAADRVQTGIDAAAAAQSALDAEVAKIEWQGTYSGATAYVLNDAVTYLGSSYINIQAGTGQTPVIGGTAYWDDLANKGDSVSADWGTIGGTLSNQTDLQTALDAASELPIGYINGGRVDYVDDDSVSVTAGECKNEEDSADITILANADVTAVLVANTTYFVNVDSGGVSTISTSIGTGTNRKIGTFLTDGAGDIRPFTNYEKDGGGVDTVYVDEVVDRSASLSVGSENVSLTVPDGITISVSLVIALTRVVAGDGFGYMSEFGKSLQYFVGGVGINTQRSTMSPVPIYTSNATVTIEAASNDLAVYQIRTNGYTDERSS